MVDRQYHWSINDCHEDTSLNELIICEPRDPTQKARKHRKKKDKKRRLVDLSDIKINEINKESQVMVVDDEFYMLQISQLLLRKLGVQADYAINGEVAIQLLNQRLKFIADG